MLLRTKLIAAVAAGAVASALTIGGLMVAFDGSSVNTALGNAQKQIETTESALQTAEKVIQGLENELKPSSTNTDNPSSSNIASDSKNNTKTKEQIAKDIDGMPNKYKGLYEYELGQVNKANSQVDTWNKDINTETTDLNTQTTDFTNFMTTVAKANNLTIKGLPTSSSDSTSQHNEHTKDNA